MYDERHFLCQFQTWRSFVLPLVAIVNTHYLYFVLKWNASGATGLFVVQKCTIMTTMLAYGIAIDALDKYVYIGKEHNYEKLQMLLLNEQEVFKLVYL